MVNAAAQAACQTAAVGAFLYRPVPGGAEQPPVRAGAVPLDVGAQKRDQLRRDGDRPHLVLGAVLEAACLAGSTVIGPATPGAGLGGRQVDPAPPRAGK